MERLRVIAMMSFLTSLALPQQLAFSRYQDFEAPPSSETVEQERPTATSIFGMSLSNVYVIGIATAAQAFSQNGTTKSKSDGLLGYGFGGLKDFKNFVHDLDFQTGVLFLNRKFGKEGSFSYSSNFLEVPLVFRKNVSNFSFGLGGYTALLLGEVSNNSAPPLSLGALDYGLQSSLGYLVFSKFLVDFRFSMGLANLSNTNTDQFRFNELDLMLGYRFD